MIMIQSNGINYIYVCMWMWMYERTKRHIKSQVILNMCILWSLKSIRTAAPNHQGHCCRTTSLTHTIIITIDLLSIYGKCSIHATTTPTHSYLSSAFPLTHTICDTRELFTCQANENVIVYMRHNDVIITLRILVFMFVIFFFIGNARKIDR